MRRTLVIGLTGQVGSALRPRLPELGDVWAVSRNPGVDEPGLHWLPGYLQAMPDLPDDIDTVVSLGPLDAFSEWFEREGLPGARVVALGSTGRADKQRSLDPAEQAVALALSAAEARLFDAAHRLGATVTLLRPTLIYGHDRDASLSTLLVLARKFRAVPLPVNATGLRQPVHVDDVVRAILDCLEAPAAFDRAFDLPGGERLEFRAMVERSLAKKAPRSRVILLPSAVFRTTLAMMRKLGLGNVGPGFAQRLAQDQVADPGPARDAFGFRPRGFEP